ncbi:MAG TPA: D-sedoheptulose 7-phosphate isomerase [Terriglobales bacterium]|nr:D-sedoheptulose 7-phosphate isomerase [Terriglobales bacterium]
MSPGLTMDKLVAGCLQESIALKQLLLCDENYELQVTSLGHAMAQALASGHKVIYFGNGGSAADAQHLAAELTGRYMMERPGLAGLSLTSNTSSLTAIGNDYGYEMVFARQLDALGCPGDVTLGISTSGMSPNVVRAMELARSKSIITAALTGKTGGALLSRVDYCVRIPSECTPRIQEAHILTGHILCEIIEHELFSK